jgi:hypothetical protein
MANLAYLYSAERPDAWHPPEEGSDYSRWVIPLAWFFFYRASDIAWVDATFDGTVWWKEARFSVEKDTAIKDFADRRPLLSSLIGSYIGDQDIDRFLEDNSGRPGRYLIMDPHEVLGDEWDAAFFARIFEMIEKGQSEGLAELDHEGSDVGGIRNGRDSCLRGVFGHRYGR